MSANPPDDMIADLLEADEDDEPLDTTPNPLEHLPRWQSGKASASYGRCPLSDGRIGLPLVLYQGVVCSDELNVGRSGAQQDTLLCEPYADILYQAR